MRPYIPAVCTAMAWGIGGYFEKKGLHQGNLPAVVGITVRTAVAVVVLGLLSIGQWQAVAAAGKRNILYVAVGGGVLAGSVGMLCFYAALKGAPLGRVMPIAFTSPVFGALMGVFFGGEVMHARGMAGLLLTVLGVALLTFR